MCRALGLILWLAVSLCIAAGCAHPPLHGFEPVGPQGSAVIPITAVKYKDLAGPYFLFTEGEEFSAGSRSLFGEGEESTSAGPWGKIERRPVASEEFEADLTRMYADAIAKRPDSPTFRALCGLLQRRFTQWKRLVLLERLHTASGRVGYGDFYDFILIVVTADGVTGATSLIWDGGKSWPGASVSSPCPQPLAGNVEKIERCLSELARARKVLPQSLMWPALFPGTPLLILHDIRVDEDGKPPMLHWASVIKGSGVPMGRVPFGQEVDYGQAKWIRENCHNAVPWEFKDRFQLAVDMYETLFSRIWEAALGTEGLDVETTSRHPSTLQALEFRRKREEAFPESR